MAIACKSVGDCLIAYSMRTYGSGQSQKDIWVAPVKNGKPGASIQVTSAAGDQIAPSVVWNGTNWLVAWVDLRFATSSAPFYKGTQLYGARVTPTGAVLDPIGVSLASYPEVADNTGSFATALPEGIALAQSGSTTLLAWRGSGTYRIVGRRLSGNLSSIDVSPIVMATKGSSWVDMPRLLPAASGFTLVFGEGASSIKATNVSLLSLGLNGKPAGVPLKAGTRFARGMSVVQLADQSLVLGKTVPGPKKNSLGTPYTDSWAERVSLANGKELAAAYVSKALTAVNGRALAQAAGLGVVAYADNRNGDNYKYSNYDVYVSVLNAQTAVLPANGIALPKANKSTLRAAAGNNRAMVVWDEGSVGSRNVVGAILDVSGKIVKNVILGSQAYDESSPEVAFDGKDFIVSWVDRGNGLRRGRVSPRRAKRYLCGSSLRVRRPGANNEYNHRGARLQPESRLLGKSRQQLRLVEEWQGCSEKNQPGAWPQGLYHAVARWGCERICAAN